MPLPVTKLERKILACIALILILGLIGWLVL